MEYPEWVEAGRYLGALGRGCQWWIGDWIRYGTKKWGEKYTEAARLTGYDRGSLRNMAWVASQFDLSRRRDKLTWTHHLEVAPLELAEQDEWLDRAIEHKLSAADLRIELRALRRAREQAPDQALTDGDVSSSVATDDPDGIVCPNCGHKLPLFGADIESTSALAAKRHRRARLPIPAVA